MKDEIRRWRQVEEGEITGASRLHALCSFGGVGIIEGLDMDEAIASAVTPQHKSVRERKVAPDQAF